MAAVVFSKEDVEKQVAQAVQNYAEGELVRQVKSIVNGMKTQLEELGRDFAAFKQQYKDAYLMRSRSAMELADELHLVRLNSKEDVEVAKQMIDERKQQTKRNRWWMGKMGVLLTVLGILYTLASLTLILYNTFFGVHK